eukprot:CAMPEP_0174754386 /NCGR_PEP_ID=MMETSP1094-20130205/105709_1 /TAXON_ID=156173 /ORGANISM="Chrysochromulina brevifilum, Strain UTEX LB 985" /LENGTH=125 /DNA_ID=CAMNT_0015960251 /DNA_START=954 /DNA_END=1331 /DNA_ORIENTATION=-
MEDDNGTLSEKQPQGVEQFCKFRINEESDPEARMAVSVGERGRAHGGVEAVREQSSLLAEEQTRHAVVSADDREYGETHVPNPHNLGQHHLLTCIRRQFQAEEHDCIENARDDRVVPVMRCPSRP